MSLCYGVSAKTHSIGAFSGSSAARLELMMHLAFGNDLSDGGLLLVHKVAFVQFLQLQGIGCNSAFTIAVH